MQTTAGPPGQGLVGGHEHRAIVLVEPDADWPRRFAIERDRITGALGHDALTVEHIGSTSVPGLTAKPIIDVLVTVADVEDEKGYLAALLEAGYRLRVRDPEHRMARTPELDVHVHVLAHGHAAAAAHLALRDRLRADEDDRTLYADTKRALAQQEWPTMNHYADAKNEVIAAILGRART